ncbi:MAG: hypothetical protein AMXMBFR83_21540 [Phycisphaerae bacterium]
MKQPFRWATPVILASATPVWAIALNQVDTFQNGTVMGWSEGAASPNPPTNVATGGPAGAGDRFLRNVSSGFGSGGKMVMFNRGQWSGHYAAAGVNRIEADMINLGSTTLYMRIALSDYDESNRYATDPAVVLSPGGGWKHVVFDLTEEGMTQVEGFGTLAGLLTGVSEMRILSSQFPSWRGDDVAATLGVDNITALPEPASLLLAALGGAGSARRRRI